MNERSEPLLNAALDRDPEARRLRAKILEDVKAYFSVAHSVPAFKPGITPVPVSGKVFDWEEGQCLVSASLDFWLTTGRFNDSFEKKFGGLFPRQYALTTNSGSSANLLAITALTSQKLGKKRLRKGDEIITIAVGFPTTVNPIIQNGLVPVFVDVSLPTYNVDPTLIEEGISDRTKGMIFAHTLGNPLDLELVTTIAREHGLWLIEDCCDALGSKYHGRMVGNFGDMGTFSFYPAHHITMGEGGAVVTDTRVLAQAIESFRDWGRDCHCPPGKDNTCRNRYGFKFDGLPEGYDHKYVYSELGYNLKITDMQAAVGLAQLDKLPTFIQARQDNFDRLHSSLKDLQDLLILPEATVNSQPSWFGFPITVMGGHQERHRLVKHLENCRIGTRLMFGGNLLKQPYFKGKIHRKLGDLPKTDVVMNQTFWLGVYPGLNAPMIDYVSSTIHEFYGR
jgi:CDP-6-deoxy-D-xylo-4-hexulose-3-dehydrase